MTRSHVLLLLKQHNTLTLASHDQSVSEERGQLECITASVMVPALVAWFRVSEEVKERGPAAGPQLSPARQCLHVWGKGEQSSEQIAMQLF